MASSPLMVPGSLEIVMGAACRPPICSGNRNLYLRFQKPTLPTPSNPEIACSAAAQKRLGNVKPVAMDYVWDSASILTSFREELSKFGVIFCSMSEAVREYPDLVRQHLGSVVRWHSTAKCKMSPKCHKVADCQTPVGEPLRLSGNASTPCASTSTPWCVPTSLCTGTLVHRAATLEMLADR